jgi:hypothetical protein
MFGFMRHHSSADREWRRHYCGTCKTLGTLYGQPARMLLNHDATFLAELLNAGNGLPESYDSWNCTRMPKRDQIPVVMRYAAAINVLLSDYKVRDHEVDAPSVRWRWARRLFSPSFRKAQRDLAGLGFPLQQTDAILERQPEIEAQYPADIDALAGPTAKITAIVFAHGARLAGRQEQAEVMSRLGDHFGRLIYLIDAWQDRERDARTGQFNALRSVANPEPVIRHEAARVMALLPPAFQARLRSNLDAALGSPLRVLHDCRDRRTWREAVDRTRAWRTPALGFVVIATLAFVFYRHARLARSPQELLSMSMNLMALGAVAGGSKGRLRGCVSSCCCDSCAEAIPEACCDSCGDCCCDSCCSGCDC